MAIDTIVADYSNPEHAKDLLFLLNQYAMDPMGGNQPLEQQVLDNLITELKKVAGAFSILCYVDGSAAGFANCFMGFSTFKCKPLINIHDFAVNSVHRGKHLSQVILKKIDEVGRQQGCCKITLEVLEGNHPAKRAYQKFGFEPYELSGDNGSAHFWQKEIA